MKHCELILVNMDRAARIVIAVLSRNLCEMWLIYYRDRIGIQMIVWWDSCALKRPSSKNQ